jgi:hypothetical protein
MITEENHPCTVEQLMGFKFSDQGTYDAVHFNDVGIYPGNVVPYSIGIGIVRGYGNCFRAAPQRMIRPLPQLGFVGAEDVEYGQERLTGCPVLIMCPLFSIIIEGGQLPVELPVAFPLIGAVISGFPEVFREATYFRRHDNFVGLYWYPRQVA